MCIVGFKSHKLHTASVDYRHGPPAQSDFDVPQTLNGAVIEIIEINFKQSLPYVPINGFCYVCQ